jgi:hypothetical protein
MVREEPTIHSSPSLIDVMGGATTQASSRAALWAAVTVVVEATRARAERSVARNCISEVGSGNYE